MLSKKIFLTVCLLSILSSGCAKSVNQANDNNEQQHSNQNNIDNINVNDIRSKAEKGYLESTVQFRCNVCRRI